MAHRPDRRPVFDVLGHTFVPSPIPTLNIVRLEMCAPNVDDDSVHRGFFAEAEASHLYGGPLDAARRHGYALEASRAAVAFGYDALGWDLVETHMNDENIAARKLVEKLGGRKMVRERFPDGLDRDIFELPRP